MNLYRDFIKRALGFTLALIAIIVLSPLLLVVTVWLHFANKGAGAFFFQERPGKDGKIFKIVILKGDMALIGPRPLLVEYLPLYSPEQARRHEVRPGITGWAQCHGRNTLSWSEKFKLDVWYVDHCTFTNDVKVIFSTIKKVIARDGISQEGQATMEAFNGNN